jgi:hypothetical protein
MHFSFGKKSAQKEFLNSFQNKNKRMNKIFRKIKKRGKTNFLKIFEFSFWHRAKLF